MTTKPSDPPGSKPVDLDLCSLQLRQYLQPPEVDSQQEMVWVFDFSTNEPSGLVLRPRGHTSVPPSNNANTDANSDG